MNKTLIVMGYIYNPDGFDWMNFQLTKNNKYTFHHIVEKKNGGDDSVENGAILTDIAHKFLNILEIFCPYAYDDLQNIFIRINISQRPPTNEIMKEIDQILYDIFYTDKYAFDESVLPSNSYHRYVEARGQYVLSRSKLKKCLK